MDYKPALYDTATDSQLSVSLDLGRIPAGYPDAGQWVVTLQVLPMKRMEDAKVILESIAEAVGSRLGIKFTQKQNVA